MKNWRTVQLIIVGIWLTSILIGCGKSAATPELPAPTATATATRPEPTAPATMAPPTPTATAQAARVQIDTFTLASQALQDNRLRDPAKRPVQVILPPGYAESNKRYPVIYYLHGYGMGGDASTRMLDLMSLWFSEYAAMFASDRKAATGNLTAAVTQGVRLGETQEMILVFPNGSNVLGGTLYISSPSNGDVETYLTQELVAYIDSHYRTLPQRASRGLAGCSMGGDGTVHLAFKYPDTYSVAVAQSGLYFYDQDPLLTGASLKGFTQEPKDIQAFYGLSWETQAQIAVAAAVAPNENKPPWYFDMPYVVVDGKTEIAPGYLDKLRALDPRSDVARYLTQPTRLNALLVQHGESDPLVPVELARQFDQLLTQEGIAHELDDSFDSHCTYDMLAPMLQFMSDHLVGEGSTK